MMISSAMLAGRSASGLARSVFSTRDEILPQVPIGSGGRPDPISSLQSVLELATQRISSARIRDRGKDAK
ncbi:hypothetical protein [Kribbella yunnanensis]|uniref:hypothetical protein n=1 Tax=Kribbella yunnanensis TaxID=190194 RepID=UPI0031D013A6